MRAAATGLWMLKAFVPCCALENTANACECVHMRANACKCVQMRANACDKQRSCFPINNVTDVILVGGVATVEPQTQAKYAARFSLYRLQSQAAA